MKNSYSILLVFFFTITSINAQFYQPGSLTHKNNQTTEGRILIDNSEKKVFLKKEGKTQTYLFNTILNATINNRLYSKISFNNEAFLGYELVSGKASLYHLTEEDYLINNNEEGRVFNLKEDKMQIPGILSVLFNDCNSIRDAINKSDEINERILREIVLDYNNCNYSHYTPTENEINNTNTFNTDVVRFYGGFQTGFNNVSINDFDSNNTTGFGFGLGIAASPGFTGNLQGNLYFDFDVSMIFTGDNDFNNHLDQSLNYKVNSFKFSIGMEYLFNKKGVLQPFLGIGYGYTSDYYQSTIGSINFKDHDQNFFFIPKIGMLYQLNNGKHIGLTVSYITEYENDLSFLIGDDSYYPLVINASSINLGLNYYF